jgi:predicted esterase
MLKRLIFFVGALSLSIPSKAEVSREFLLKLQSKFKSNLGSSLSELDFQSPLEDEELEFLNKTHQFNYTDIFSQTIPKSREVFVYSNFHYRYILDALQEHVFNERTECHLVRTKDGIKFKSSKLKVFRHFFPHKEGSEHRGWKFSYCVGSDENSDSDSVMYYFHGAGGNPRDWVERKAMFEFRKRWREHGKPFPKWISVSVGTIGHLGEKGKETLFFKSIVPYIEKTLGFEDRPKHRYGFGVSQGGANVIHTVLKKDKFFDAAVAVCPAVTAVPPSSSSEEHRAYRRRTLASHFISMVVFKVIPLEFFTPEYWDKHVDAFSLGQRLLNENTTPLFIQTSSKDQLGLQEGGQLFAMLARTMGAPVVFEEVKGKHCVLRPHVLADFFHSYKRE